MGVGPDHWAKFPTASVVCFGAGGSATALAYALHTMSKTASTDSGPHAMHFTDISENRLHDLQTKLHRLLYARVLANVHFHLMPIAASTNEYTNLPSGWPCGQAPEPGSLIVNATGMGKDLPGSPIRDHDAWPSTGFVWCPRAILMSAHTSAVLPH
eukprot:SAG31_NODE_12569_length_932_cov_0.876351_2_plen_156_part_00